MTFILHARKVSAVFRYWCRWVTARAVLRSSRSSRAQNTTEFPINYHANLPCLRQSRRRQTSLALKAHRAFNPKQARRSELLSRTLCCAQACRSANSSRRARKDGQSVRIAVSNFSLGTSSIGTHLISILSSSCAQGSTLCPGFSNAKTVV